MRRETLSQILTRNLRVAMQDSDSGRGIKQKPLETLSGVPQTTISLYLRPAARLPTDGKSDPGPTLERIDRLAKALKIEPWLLLHPDMERARREADMYRKIEANFLKLPPLPADEPAHSE